MLASINLLDTKKNMHKFHGYLISELFLSRNKHNLILEKYYMEEVGDTPHVIQISIRCDVKLTICHNSFIIALVSICTREESIVPFPPEPPPGKLSRPLRERPPSVGHNTSLVSPGPRTEGAENSALPSSAPPISVITIVNPHQQLCMRDVHLLVCPECALVCESTYSIDYCMTAFLCVCLCRCV